MRPLTGIRPSLESEFKDSFKGQRILVTGSRGFIGGHLVHALAELGADVWASARTWEGWRGSPFDTRAEKSAHKLERLGALASCAQFNLDHQNESSSRSAAHDQQQSGAAQEKSGGSASLAEIAARVSAAKPQPKPADENTSLPTEKVQSEEGLNPSCKHLDRVHREEADLTDLASVRAVLTKSNPDMIFHLASTVTAQEKLDLVQPTLQNIVVASVNLMTAAAEVGCKKMVICGTAEQPADLNESPASPYAAAKEAVSTYAKLFRHKFAMDIREVKPFFTFGPGQNASKLVPHIVTSFMGRSAPMLSDADRSFDLIYVNDVVRGMIAVSLAPQPTRECIDLGTGIATTMKDLTNRIAEFTGTDVNAIFNNPDKRSSTAGRTANMSTAVQGWKPMWSLDDGLQETIAWYRRWGIHHG